MIAEALGTLWNCVLGLIFINVIICAVITAGVIIYSFFRRDKWKSQI